MPLGSSYTLELPDPEDVSPADEDPLPSLAGIDETNPVVFETISPQALADAQKSCAIVASHA